MESSPPRKTGEQFYRAFGELKFSPASAGAYLNEGFKIFPTFEGGQKKKFVCLFHVKLTFSMKSSIVTSKIY